MFVINPQEIKVRTPSSHSKDEKVSSQSSGQREVNKYEGLQVISTRSNKYLDDAILYHRNPEPSFEEGKGWGNILKAADQEVGCFTRRGVKGLSDESGRVVEQKVTLTNEQRWMLMNDIQETLELYKGCYQDSLPSETAFKALRHMARTAIYQTYFDKGVLTGSDHGVLHAHHNCGHSDEMHNAMDKGDMPTFGRLLVKLIHYYHDLGYYRCQRFQC